MKSTMATVLLCLMLSLCSGVALAAPAKDADEGGDPADKVVFCDPAREDGVIICHCYRGTNTCADMNKDLCGDEMTCEVGPESSQCQCVADKNKLRIFKRKKRIDSRLGTQTAPDTVAPPKTVSPQRWQVLKPVKPPSEAAPKK